MAAPVGLGRAGARARAALGALTTRSIYFGICKTNPTPNMKSFVKFNRFFLSIKFVHNRLYLVMVNVFSRFL